MIRSSSWTILRNMRELEGLSKMTLKRKADKKIMSKKSDPSSELSKNSMVKINTDIVKVY